MKDCVRHSLDLRGTILSFTLLKVSKAFKTIQPGDTLEVWWSDPGTPEDLFRILPESSYDLIRMERVGEAPSAYRMEIKRKPVAAGH